LNSLEDENKYKIFSIICFSRSSLNGNSMKLVKFFIWVLFTFTIAQPYSSAQEWTVSQDVKLVKDTYFKILGKWGQDYKMARIGNNFVELLTYKEDLTVRWGRVLDIVQDAPVIHEVFEGDNKFYLLYSIQQGDSTRLLLSRYDRNGTIVSNMILKTVSAELGRPIYDPMLSLNNEWITFSFMGADGLFELLIVNLDGLVKVREDVYDLSSFKLEGTYPHVHITDDGQVFIFVEYFELIQNRPQQFMTVLQVFLDDRPTVTKEVSFGAVVVESPIFAYYPDNESINIFGIYRDFRIAAGMGIYHKVIYTDFTKDDKSSTFPIESALLNQFHKKSRNALPGIPGLRMAEAKFRADGSASILAEVRFDVPRESSVGGLRGQLDMDHFYEEIFAMTIKPDGSPGFQRLMNKVQHSYNDNAVKSSFFDLEMGEVSLLIFNESIKKNAPVKAFELNWQSGSIQEKNLFDEKRHSKELIIEKAFKVSDNEVLIPSKSGRVANLVRFRIAPVGS
jgi:hypothetical protein